MRILLILLFIIFGFPLLIRLVIKLIAVFLKFKFLSSHNSQPSMPNNNGNRMVRCAKCKLYIPENEAIVIKNNFYCSKEHSQEQ